MDHPADYYNIDESYPMILATCVKYMREALNANFKEHGFPVSNETVEHSRYSGPTGWYFTTGTG